jgi:hypothetical protein
MQRVGPSKVPAGGTEPTHCGADRNSAYSKRSRRDIRRGAGIERPVKWAGRPYDRKALYISLSGQFKVIDQHIANAYRTEAQTRESTGEAGGTEPRDRTHIRARGSHLTTDAERRPGPLVKPKLREQQREGPRMCVHPGPSSPELNFGGSRRGRHYWIFGMVVVGIWSRAASIGVSARILFQCWRGFGRPSKTDTVDRAGLGAQKAVLRSGIHSRAATRRISSSPRSGLPVSSLPEQSRRCLPQALNSIRQDLTFDVTKRGRNRHR